MVQVESSYKKKKKKKVLNATLFNIQHKVKIKGKVEQSKEHSSALPNTLV